jgi:hypothetical protein
MRAMKKTQRNGTSQCKTDDSFCAHSKKRKVLAEMAKTGWYKASTGCRFMRLNPSNVLMADDFA